MLISISKNKSNTEFLPKEVRDIEEVARLALKGTISPGVFKDNYRNLENFMHADFIGLDIDEGMTLEQAKDAFSGYIHAILPTRNHQKKKNGKICDRFRVFLQLENRIENEKDFYETWFELDKKFNSLDSAAKDPSRQFYKSKEIASLSKEGNPVKIKKWSKPEKKEVLISTGAKGELAKDTYKFLAQGAATGGRNNALYKVFRDMHQNNYTREEAVSMVQNICTKIGLDETEIELVADSAFSKDPKHDPRIEENAFMPVTVDELYKKKDVALNWLLKDLLPMGACSLLAGPPKAGKSTLVRQLCASVAMGADRFLNRSVRQGKVLYLALEEQTEVLKEEYKRLGIKGDNFFVFVGAINKEKIMQDLEKFIVTNEISLVVIDTLMVFGAIEDSNNYREAYDAMTLIRDLARKTGTHIMCIHHTNKSEVQSANNIMGSNAFLGGVDVAIIFKMTGQKRYIQSYQRPGKPFTGQELVFNSSDNTYTIRKKNDKDKRNF